MRYEGGCLCGASRYVAKGEPLNERVCHCRLCQRAVGAAFHARLLFHAKDVSIAGPIGKAASSPTMKRGFCRDCGTSLFSAREAQGVMALTSGTLDDPALFQPTAHIWTDSKQPWIKLDDGLPQHPQAAPD